MENEYYRIIDIEEISDIYFWDRAILVKANKAELRKINDVPFGLSYSVTESSNTDWFVFKFSEERLNLLIELAKKCDNNELWEVDKDYLRPICTPIEDNGYQFVKDVFVANIYDKPFCKSEDHSLLYNPQYDKFSYVDPEDVGSDDDGIIDESIFDCYCELDEFDE